MSGSLSHPFRHTTLTAAFTIHSLPCCSATIRLFIYQTVSIILSTQPTSQINIVTVNFQSYSQLVFATLKQHLHSYMLQDTDTLSLTCILNPLYCHLSIPPRDNFRHSQPFLVTSRRRCGRPHGKQ